MARLVLLTIHISSGTAGLLVGPLAMRARKRGRWHTRLGLTYQALTAGLCGSALGLVVLNPGVWPLAVIAVATELAAVAGWRVRRLHRPGWLPRHISLMCGSYVSFVTAFLVVNLPGRLLPWILPTIVATPLIRWTAARHAAAPLASTSTSETEQAARQPQPAGTRLRVRPPRPSSLG